MFATCRMGLRRTASGGQGSLRHYLALGVVVGLLCPSLASAIDVSPPPQSTAVGLSVLWRTRLGKLPVMAWKPRATAAPRLTHDAKGVIFASAHGVTMLRVSDGALQWHHKSNDAIEGHTAERDGVIYAASAAGQVYALDRRTGRNLWPATMLRAAVHAGVVTDARHLYVVADPGTVYAVLRKTGKVAWRRSASTAREFLVEGHGAALLLGNVVLAGTAGGRLLALSARDGAVAWQTKICSHHSPYTDVDSTPVRLGADRIVASSHNTGVAALSAADGAISWQAKIHGARQPWIYHNTIYVVAAGGALHALRANGSRRWARKILTQPSGALAFVGDLILVPTEGGLLLVRRSDGVSVARFADGFGFAAAPLVIGRRVFAISNAGVAYSFALSR